MRTVHKPDLHAPRFREASMSILDNKFLRQFKIKYPQYHALTLAEFRGVVMTFNTNVIQGVIENRNGVELPDGLGFIFMGTCPPSKKRNVDIIKSMELGVEVTHQNWDSDNNLLKIFYTNNRTKYPFANKQVWVFKAIKTFRKKASMAYKENFSKYIEVSPNIKISSMFDRFRKKEYLQNMKPIIPEGYDEFKL